MSYNGPLTLTSGITKYLKYIFRNQFRDRRSHRA